MKKILLTMAVIGFAFANTFAQAPASVGTAKQSPNSEQADPAKPAAKPAHEAIPAPASKATPAAVGTEKNVHVIQATDPGKSPARAGVHPTPGAKESPASVKTVKSEPSSGKKKDQKEHKQETPSSEKK